MYAKKGYLTVSREAGTKGWLLLGLQEPLLTEILAEDAGRRGYEVRLVGYPAQAMEALKIGRVAVAIGDMDAPHLPGIELLQLVSSVSGNIPVVLVGRQGVAKIAAETMREGAFAFLAKPFEPYLLAATAWRALEMYELRAELLDLKLRGSGAFPAALPEHAPATAGNAGPRKVMVGSPCARIGQIERSQGGAPREGEARRAALRRALEAHGWNFRLAAEALGMRRSVLYEEACRLGVCRGNEGPVEVSLRNI